MEFIAGLDGGGTKTTLLYKYKNSNLISEKTFGPFNLNGIGKEAFTYLIKEIASFLDERGECVALCIGASGSSNKKMDEIIDSVFSSSKIQNWKVVGDNEIALEGAFDGKAGIIVICGTGSICFAKCGDSTLLYSGGWGHLLGDEGSGYALARDALKAVTALIDGYGKETVLFKLLKDELAIFDRSSIISFVYSSDKKRIATISHLVEKAGRMGDEIALEIILDNAYRLALTVNSVSQKQPKGEKRVALCGGIISNDTLLRKYLIEEIVKLDKDVEIVEPLFTPEYGALRLAERM